MQQITSIYNSGGAYVHSALKNGVTGNRQSEADPGPPASAWSLGHDSHVLADSRLLRAAGPAESQDRASSSGKLKDTLLMSFIDWFHEHLKIAGHIEKVSTASKNDLLSDISRKISDSGVAEYVAGRIAADSEFALRAQANVSENTALHLLSAGAVAETVHEPGQKQQTLFDADDTGVRVRAKVAQTSF